MALMVKVARAALPLEGLALEVVACNSVDMMDIVTDKTPHTGANIDTTCRMGQCLSRLRQVVLHLHMANHSVPCVMESSCVSDRQEKIAHATSTG